MIFNTRFKKDWSYYKVKLHVKSASFSADNGQTSRLSSFTVSLTIKTSSQNISITLLQIRLKIYEHRGGYWRTKLPWTILEEQFLVPRYNVASKIGNSVISLLWQLRCPCNPDHNNFSSLSNTTVVASFPNLCLWRRSSCSNLGGTDPKKLYRATLNKKRGSKWWFRLQPRFNAGPKGAGHKKRRLLKTLTTNRPNKLSSNNQEVLVYQNPVSNLSDPWVERNDNVPTSAAGIYNGTENIFTKCQGSTAKRLKKRDI